MIVYQIKKIGPQANPSFTGDTESTPLSNMVIFGRAWQNGTPTVDDPVNIEYIGPTSLSLSVSAGGSTSSITIPISAGLKGLKYEEYWYLVGNGSYLTTQNGDRLVIK